MTPSEAAPEGRPSVAVVVPSYRRPALLQQCLEGLRAQEQPADQVVVVRRQEDAGTQDVLRDWQGFVTDAVVDAPGLLAALRRGVRATSTQVVAFTDDDAVPRPEWLSRLTAHYSDPQVGGVGGRDVIEGESGPEVPSSRVGRVSSWGRLVGNQHLGVGPAVEVDVLKGVNMSFRREALALPQQLHGAGAQVHNEVCVSLWAQSRGWRLVYDPAVVVDHYPGPRFDADRRDRRELLAVEHEAFNLVWTMLSFRPELALRRAVYGLLLGDRATPGLLRALVALTRSDLRLVQTLAPSLKGQSAALLAVARGRRPVMVAAAAAAP